MWVFAQQFLYSKNMANFEAFRRFISSSINLLFPKSASGSGKQTFNEKKSRIRLHLNKFSKRSEFRCTTFESKKSCTYAGSMY